MATSSAKQSIVTLFASSPAVQRAVSILALLALWQAASSVSLNAYYVSSPLAVISEIARWVWSGDLWPHLAATLTNMLLGFVAAAFAATAFALLLAGNPMLDKVAQPILLTAFSTPKIIFAPILILWVGIGRPAVVTLAFIAAFFTIFFNVSSGVRSVPKIYLDTAAILGASRWATAWKFHLPAAAPYVLAGLHQGLIYAFHGTILGEMTASDTGIGYLIIYGATSQDATQVLSGLVIIGAISFTLLRLLDVAAHRGLAVATNAGPVT